MVDRVIRLAACMARERRVPLLIPPLNPAFFSSRIVCLSNRSRLLSTNDTEAAGGRLMTEGSLIGVGVGNLWDDLGVTLILGALTGTADIISGAPMTDLVGKVNDLVLGLKDPCRKRRVLRCLVTRNPVFY